jgi:hypothetical protein
VELPNDNIGIVAETTRLRRCAVDLLQHPDLSFPVVLDNTVSKIVSHNVLFVISHFFLHSCLVVGHSIHSSEWLP